MGSDQTRREKGRLTLSGEFAQSAARADARAESAIQSSACEFRLDRRTRRGDESGRRASRNERRDRVTRSGKDGGGDGRRSLCSRQSGAKMQNRRGKRTPSRYGQICDAIQSAGGRAESAREETRRRRSRQDG